MFPHHLAGLLSVSPHYRLFRLEDYFVGAAWYLQLSKTVEACERVPIDLGHRIVGGYTQVLVPAMSGRKEMELGTTELTITEELILSIMKREL